MSTISNVNAVIATVGKAVDYVSNNIFGHVTDNSIIGVGQLLRAEPLTVISQDCANIEQLPMVLNTLSSVYSSYFLQAVSIMSLGVTNVEIVRILDSLNPNRDNTGFMLQSRQNAAAKTWENVRYGLENCEYRLPSYKTAALEVVIGRDNQKVLYEHDNLIIGKMLDVAISLPGGEDGRPQTLNVPVSVRLIPIFAQQETLSYIFTHRKGAESFTERLESVRAGRIELIKDMIFCQDLIKEYRAAVMKDKSGALKEIVKRVNNNRKYGLLTANPSLAISSNIFVISSNQARELEGKLGLKFSKAADREKILAGTYAMIVCVIDQDAEQVDIYFDGIAQGSTITFRSMKSKSKGPDIGDVLQSLLRGQAPSF